MLETHDIAVLSQLCGGVLKWVLSWGVHDPHVSDSWEFEQQDKYPSTTHGLTRFFTGQRKPSDLRIEHDLKRSLDGMDAVIFAVRHQAYPRLEPDKVVATAGGPIEVVDCFGILDDFKIRRYFEFGCEVKVLVRGHVKRIKDRVQEERQESCSWGVLVNRVRKRRCSWSVNRGRGGIEG